MQSLFFLDFFNFSKESPPTYFPGTKRPYDVSSEAQEALIKEASDENKNICERIEARFILFFIEKHGLLERDALPKELSLAEVREKLFESNRLKMFKDFPGRYGNEYEDLLTMSMLILSVASNFNMEKKYQADLNVALEKQEESKIVEITNKLDAIQSKSIYGKDLVVNIDLALRLRTYILFAMSELLFYHHVSQNYMDMSGERVLSISMMERDYEGYDTSDFLSKQAIDYYFLVAEAWPIIKKAVDDAKAGKGVITLTVEVLDLLTKIENTISSLSPNYAVPHLFLIKSMYRSYDLSNEFTHVNRNSKLALACLEKSLATGLKLAVEYSDHLKNKQTDSTSAQQNSSPAQVPPSSAPVVTLSPSPQETKEKPSSSSSSDEERAKKDNKKSDDNRKKRLRQKAAKQRKKKEAESVNDNTSLHNQTSGQNGTGRSPDNASSSFFRNTSSSAPSTADKNGSESSQRMKK